MLVFNEILTKLYVQEFNYNLSAHSSFGWNDKNSNNDRHNTGRSDADITGYIVAHLTGLLYSAVWTIYNLLRLQAETSELTAVWDKGAVSHQYYS
jgi:hypothetical protein